MEVALVQLDIVWEDKEANFDRVRELVSDLSFSPRGESPGPPLLVLPELFATGFTMASKKIAEDDGGPTETFLTDLAKEKSAYVIGGVAKSEPYGLKPSNCSVIASPEGEIVCRYRKTHPFSLGDEDQNYSRGSKIETVELDEINISPSICYDLRFPEVYRIAAYQDAEIYVNIANWPEKRNQHWITLLKARAIENQAFVLGVNRCGSDPNLTYLGSTIAVDYMGETIADAGSEEGVVRATLDIQGLDQWREGFPALRDMHDNLSN